MTLQEIADRLRTFAERTYAGGGKHTQLLPLLHAETADNKVIAAGLPWSSSAEKQQQLDVAKKVLKRHGAVRYGIIAEAWAANYQPHNAPYQKLPPSKREDRVEIISIITADRDGNNHCVAYKIVRDGRGRPSVGEEYRIATEDGETIVTAGQMLELLEE